MALIWKQEEAQAVPGPVKGFSWDAWYAKNKARLAEKRARRYKEDAAYRAAALERSRQQRKTKQTPVTDGHTVSFVEAAGQVGVTVWVLREWRRKDYFPEPFKRDGRLWFSPDQVGWLQVLHKFFQEHGPRATQAIRPELDGIVNLIYANWA